MKTNGYGMGCDVREPFNITFCISFSSVLSSTLSCARSFVHSARSHARQLNMAFMIKCWHCHEKWPNICIPYIYFLSLSVLSLPLYMCVCEGASGYEISPAEYYYLMFAECHTHTHTCPEAQSSKADCDDVWCCCFTAHVVAVVLLMLVADWKLWRTHREKKRFKNYIALRITNRCRFVQTVAIIAAWLLLTSRHPRLIAQLYTYASPSNDKFQRPGRKITAHSSSVRACERVRASVCVSAQCRRLRVQERVYTYVPNKAFGLPGKMRPSQLFTLAGNFPRWCYGHRIQSANMKCRWSLGQFG